MPRFARANGLDFGVIPNELQGLSLVEQRIIALVLPIVSVRIHYSSGQTRSSGYLIHFDNELPTIVKQLPRTVDDLRLYDVDLPIGSDKVRRIKYSPYKVLKSLQWLTKFNPLYREIAIETNFRRSAENQRDEKQNKENVESEEQTQPEERWIEH